ncbi:hypothetical protein TrST_g8602 [Triparma strigata]|uniref:Uncharacterized protein n=1 Tax=Triparma strigata TaxID=1606541 RepID=A0A9W6ZH30_9STRA|nr:hypothetical protein TrST_g8602 [Triparma strigata]
MIRWSRTNNQCQEDWAEGEECREEVCVSANCDREAWKSDFDAKLEKVCSSADNLAVCGFKLMYNQVGPMPWKSGVFVGPPEDGSLDPELLEYFWERDIRDVVNRVKGGLTAWEAHHQKESNTTNLDLPKAVITPEQEKSIIKIEAVNEFWRSALMFGNIRYHYIAYEHLLSPSLRSSYMREVLFFLGAQSSIDDVDPFAHEDDALKKFGSSSCHERVEDYEEISKRIQGTRTARACKFTNGF